MRALLKIGFLSVLVSLSSCSIARHGPVATSPARINWPKPAGQHDGTYSTHNYKHTNKALQARRAAGSNGIRVSYPQPGTTHLANYKTPVPGRVPTGGVVVHHQPATDLAQRQYKMLRPMGLRNTAAPNPNRASLPERPFETLNRRPAPLTIPVNSPTNAIN